MYIRGSRLWKLVKKMSLKEILRTAGVSLEELSAMVTTANEEPDLAQLRKDAGYKTQEEIVEDIKLAFLENGIHDRTMTTKSWSEYERGVRVPRLSLKGWLVLCKVLGCSQDELIKAIERSGKQADPEN